MPGPARFALKARTVSVMVAAALLGASHANATSICGKIRAELNSATETIGNTAEVRAYQRAIAEQQQEIARVRGDLARHSCGSGSILDFGNGNAAACDYLGETLQRMYDNLADLRDHNVQIVHHSLSRARRAQLLNALEDNGCNDVPDTPRADFGRPSPEPANFGSDDALEPPPSDAETTIRNLSGGDRGGNLQTVCVRTCDGGFFPVSTNTSPASFARDAQVCSMMCPNVETELFYHGVGTQEMVDMVSAAGGTPYKDEPYAFRFRDPNRKISKACGCNFSAYYRDMMKREAGKNGDDGESGSVAPQPSAPAKKHSSIVNLDTKPEPDAKRPSPVKKPAAAQQAATEAPARPYDPASNTVRQVGPQFLPDKNSGIDLRHPKDGAAQ